MKSFSPFIPADESRLGKLIEDSIIYIIPSFYSDDPSNKGLQKSILYNIKQEIMVEQLRKLFSCVIVIHDKD